MRDEFDYLSSLLVAMRNQAREAWGVTNELNRDRLMGNAEPLALTAIRNILREIATVEVDIDLARSTRKPPSGNF